TTPSKPSAPQPVQQALASMVRPALANPYVRSWIGMSRGENGKTRVTYVWEPLPAKPGLTRKEEVGRVSLLAATAGGNLVYRGKVPAATPPDPAATRTSSVSFDVTPGKIDLRTSVEGVSGGVLDNDAREVIVPDLS